MSDCLKVLAKVDNISLHRACNVDYLVITIINQFEQEVIVDALFQEEKQVSRKVFNLLPRLPPICMRPLLCTTTASPSSTYRVPFRQENHPPSSSLTPPPSPPYSLTFCLLGVAFTNAGADNRRVFSPSLLCCELQ